jgi:hypothetical protein
MGTKYFQKGCQGAVKQKKKNDALAWLNFINVQHSAFRQADPESVKFQLSSQYLFTLLGSECVKAACRTLMKLKASPRRNFFLMLFCGRMRLALHVFRHLEIFLVQKCT